LKRLLALVAALLVALAPAAFAQQTAPRPALELQRTVSKEFVGQGDSASLTYRVENTGNVPLSDIGVTDPLCGRVLSLATLDPGEYETVQVSMAVTKQCSSAPQAVWHYADMRYERTLDPLTISPAENRLRAELAADRSGALMGETALFAVRLTNEGNTELYDVRLTDRGLGELGTLKGVIRPGESAQWNFQARIVQSSVFCVTAQARTQSNETVTARTDEFSVVLAEDPNGAQLRISAAPAERDAPRGTAAVRITLHNDGATPIANVTISERTLGPLRTLASVAPGQTEFELECAAEKEQEMLFLAQFAAGENSRTTVLAPRVLLAPGTADPPSLLQGDPVQLGVSAYAVLMYGALSLIALFALVFLLRRAKKRRRMRLAREKRARRMRILRKNARMNEAEWVQTRPHRPVSLKENDETEQ